MSEEVRERIFEPFFEPAGGVAKRSPSSTRVARQDLLEEQARTQRGLAVRYVRAISARARLSG